MSLYREELMEIYKNPAHRGTIQKPSVTVHKKNAMCGDEIDLVLEVKDNKISDARFDGSACSVSIISSDLLLDFVVGKTLEEASKITKDDLLKLIDLNLTTSRVKCATLVLNALTTAIEKYQKEHKQI